MWFKIKLNSIEWVPTKAERQIPSSKWNLDKQLFLVDERQFYTDFHWKHKQPLANIIVQLCAWALVQYTGKD